MAALESYLYDMLLHMSVCHYTQNNPNYNKIDIEKLSKNIKVNRYNDFFVFSSDVLTIYAKNENIHRLGGPAIIFKNGTSNEWVQNGLLHRLDGPAVNYPSRTEFWINGKRYEPKNYYRILFIVSKFINLLKRIRIAKILQRVGKKTKYISSKISFFLI